MPIFSLDIDMAPSMKVKYEALRRQLKRARKRGDVHQVHLTQQLIARLLSLSMSSASTGDNTSDSGSSGRLSQGSEKLSLPDSFVPKEVLIKNTDAMNASVSLLAVSESPSSAHTCA